MAIKKFSDYAIEGQNVTLTYDNVNDTVTFDVVVDKNTVGLGNVDNTSDVNKPISNATQTALNGKQNTLTFTPEDVANKSTTLDADKLSNIKYPSVKSVYDWATLTFQTALGFTPVTNARTISINGTSYDLSANRSWTVGDLVSSGSYSNPTWLTALAWGKITSTPTTLSGYGITDAVPSSRTLTINGTTYDLSANRSWTISTATPTLDAVTTAGNTTTNAISVGGLTSIGDVVLSGNRVIKSNGNTESIYTYGGSSYNNGSYFGVNGNNATNNRQKGAIEFYSEISNASVDSGSIAFGTHNAGSSFIWRMLIFKSGNLLLTNTAVGTTLPTDAGYKLDVNGTARLNGATTIVGTTVISSSHIYVTNNFGYRTYNNSGQTRPLINANSSNTTIISSVGNGISLYSDNQFNLLVNISESGKLTTSGSITASTALAQGVYFNNTLVAAANNDVLVGLDINPTFTNGAFTGVSNIGVRVQKGTLRLASISADPTTAANGDMYYNTTLNLFRVFQGGAWKSITAI